jgi:dolichyl-phosphate beta-glucosyltransferase
VLLSIVLPAFNEEHRIGLVLDQLMAYRAATEHDLEIVVVDDGSTDNTLNTLQVQAETFPELKVLALSKNMGKGRAVATGMTAATGAYRAFFDADGATPIREVDRLLEAATTNKRSVAIGSVRAEGTNVVRKQPILRTVAGRVGNGIIRSLVLPGVADSQRGCKLFPAEVADVVFGAQITDGWMFDIEVLALSRRMGYDIIEVPVDWTHIEGSQVRPIDYFWTLFDVMKVRRLLRTNAHGVPQLAAAPRRLSISPAQRRPAQQP